jgi:arabinose-5-phosphate isomerase
MQLVIGDCLAVALLEARGFTADHFKTFHPGGQLGANLTHVGDIMHSGDRMPLVPVGTSMSEAVMVLSQKRFGCVCITDGERLAGIITDGDLARNLHRNLAELKVEDIMTRNPITVERETLAGTAIRIINSNNISALIVVEGGIPLGIVHFHDLLQLGAA